MKKNKRTSDPFEEIQQVMDGFMVEAGRLLKSAGLELPDEPMPNVEFSNEPVRCYDPASGIIDFDPSKHYGYLEALGAYHPSDRQPEDRLFLLFPANINSVAARFTFTHTCLTAMDKGFKRLVDRHFRQITALVLCHEVAHWLVHRSISANGSRMGDLRYQKNDEIFFHEGLAQALVFAAFENLPEYIPSSWSNGPDLHDIMWWMETGQPQQYIAYKRLGFDGVKILKAMDYLRSIQLQSFEMLEQVVNQMKDGDVPDQHKIFELFLKTPFTPYFQVETMPDVECYLKANLPSTFYDHRGIIYGSRYGL